MTRLNGKTAVITGGTSGIGLATAQLFIKEGANVIITGQNETRLQEAANKLGSNAIPVSVSVQHLENIDNLFGQIKILVGSIDV
ncbi:SDR family NAD(P)-dependent oxidoreductase, partial [Leptolyngbya cf. ectocarpi LEGE 11479]